MSEHNRQAKQLIIGMGESGMALLRHAVRSNTTVAVYDSRQEPPNKQTVLQNYPDVQVYCGAFATGMLDEVVEVVLSPGLSPHAEPLKTILSAAKERSIAVLGELDVFGRALAELAHTQDYHPKVLAVTGTNGKTTVTSMTRHLCLSAGVGAVAAGNISPSMLDALEDALTEGTLPEVWVLELSSFQLQHVQSFNPHAATVLNISQDHLDWHTDMQEYVAAKANVFGRDTVAVLNRDDEQVMGMAQKVHTSISFGVSVPVHLGEYGLTQDAGAQGMTWLSWAHNALGFEAQIPASTRVSKKLHADAPTEVVVQRFMPVDALKIRGRHNSMNALAALALCQAIGLPLAQLLHGLSTYAGEPHRVEWVCQVNEVEFYDDSKGTNVGASLAAITGLGKPLVLIAGGDGKGQDFAPMVPAIKEHVIAICLIGKDASVMAHAWQDAGVPIQQFASLEEATRSAAQQAQAGQAVLLSPACASLDMFKNYAHRAQVYVDVVREWAHDCGQV